MADASARPVTLLIDAVRRGEPDATDRLLSAVYDELRAMARDKLARLPPGQTLQATALVHEAYLRLAGGDPQWQSRAHFFGAAARAMRNILVDRYRAQQAQKRGGERARAELDETVLADDRRGVDLVALDDALARLEAFDRRKSEVVMLRFFAGLTHEQIAEALGASLATIERDWSFARAWLRRELSADGDLA